MRAPSLLRLLLLPAGFGFAVAQGSVHVGATGFEVPPIGSGCPINFGAALDGRARAQVIQDQQNKAGSPRLKLVFERLDSPPIAGARVVVHGLSSASRYLPLSGLPGSARPSEDRTQGFDIDQQTTTTGLADSEVLVTRMALVRWADVTELRYADGSVWRASADAQCRAVPSGFRLVSATAP